MLSFLQAHIAGSSDIIDCAINSAYYKSKGFNVLEAGIAEQCYSSPNEAPVNMGPRYSADGATQTARLPKRIVSVSGPA